MAGEKGGKAKKKWSKAKTREKLDNAVLFDKATYDKLCKEVPSMKMITPAILSERFKVSASLAQKAMRDLESKGLIRNVIRHNKLYVCTRGKQ